MGKAEVAFLKDYAGRQVMASDFPFWVEQPVPMLKNQNLNVTIIAYALIIFVLTLLFWPLNAMLRTHYGYRAELAPDYRSSRMIMRLICILNLAFVAGFVAWGASIDENIGLLSSHFDGRLHLLQVVGVLGVIGAMYSVFYFVRSWKDESLWGWTKFWNTLLMLACVGYAFFLLNWHLLNFKLNY